MAADEDELIAAALGASEEEYPAAIAALVEHGGPRVEVAAVALLEAPEPIVQILGLDLLVQLTFANRVPMRSAVAAVAALIDREPDLEVLSTAILAARDLCDPRALPAVLRRVDHPVAEIRRAVAMALPFIATREDGGIDAGVGALEQLMRDPQTTVRDWATTSLGSLTDADGPEIRAALLERLDDEDAATRVEALAGLARRHDPRAFGLLHAALQEPDAGYALVQSAGWLADPRLLDVLVRLRSRWDPEDADELETAIARCDPVVRALEVADGRALLEAADHALPGQDLRISTDRFNSDTVIVEIGPDTGMVRSLRDFLDFVDRDTDAAIAILRADLDPPDDDNTDTDTE